MAVVKAYKGGRSLGSALNYAGRESITSGKDCPNNAREALEQMEITKKIYDQGGGRLYKPYIQSFSPTDNITAEKANQLGREWAEKCFPGLEVFIGTHTDRNHIHNHIIVNSVNFESGRKLQVSKKDLERFKQENDQICLREGLSTPLKGQRQEVTTWSMSKQKLLERINAGENVKSYVLDTAIAVQIAAQHSGNKTEFIQSLGGVGYKVDWQEHRKNVTFQHPNGRKVRLKNLEKTFNSTAFTKEGLELEFSRIEKEKREIAEQGLGRGRSRSYQQQFGDSGTRRVRTGHSKKSGNYSPAKILSDIGRKLQQIEGGAKPGVECGKILSHGRKRENHEHERE